MSVAFVTGGSRGIGLALCEQLVDAGYRVYACATSPESVERIPDGVVGFVCDVSDASEVERTFGALATQEEGIDLLFNNAGVLGPRAEIADVTPEEWAHTFAVNAHGAFHVARAALPFVKRVSGKIVNVSSSVGRKGRGGWGPYACSKHALEGLTDVLADELHDDGVFVASVNPGGTATDMRAEALPDEDPSTLPTAKEIAAVILELCRQAQPSDTGAKWNCRNHR